MPKDWRRTIGMFAGDLAADCMWITGAALRAREREMVMTAEEEQIEQAAYIQGLQTTIAAQAARIAALEAALGPLTVANIGDQWHEDVRVRLEVRVSDVRRARALLDKPRA